MSRIGAPVRPVGPPGEVTPPPGVDLLELVRAGAAPPPVSGVARVWVARGRALGLRRLARPIGAGERDGRPGDVVELDLRGVDTLARWTGGYGPDVVVLEPPRLAEAVRAAWQAAQEAHAAPAQTPVGRAGPRPSTRVAASTATLPAPAGVALAAEPRVETNGAGRVAAGPSSVSSRFPRLLSLVPYLLARPGVRVAEVAEDFGITERQLRRDLELLWVCGLPGYGPGDLVDLSFSGDTVTVTEDAGMRRPLRLTTAEATTLLVALRALAQAPGMVDTDAVRRAVAKIEAAVGAAVAPGMAVGLAAWE